MEKYLAFHFTGTFSNPVLFSFGHTLKSPGELSKMLRLGPTPRRTTGSNWSVGEGPLCLTGSQGGEVPALISVHILGQ